MQTRSRLVTCILVPLCSGLASADASPCTEQLRQIELMMQQSKAHPALRQAVDAQLHHQPTPETVGSAVKAAHAEADALLAQARALDADGKSGECMNVVLRLRAQLQL